MSLGKRPRRPARRRQLEVSTLSSLYLKEKALEEEYPGIGFRDAAGGREAYVLGHRIEYLPRP